MKGLTICQQLIPAWMEGRKCVTRRLVKFNLDGRVQRGHKQWHIEDPNCVLAAPYRPGETVYIKETWDFRPMPSRVCIVGYKADSSTHAVCIPDAYNPTIKKGWRSPRLMPAWAARSHALIKSAKPERLQEITRTDAIREGVMAYSIKDYLEGAVRPDQTAADLYFRELWKTLYGPGSWNINPWVFRYELEKLP